MPVSISKRKRRHSLTRLGLSQSRGKSWRIGLESWGAANGRAVDMLGHDPAADEKGHDERARPAAVEHPRRVGGGVPEQLGGGIAGRLLTRSG